MSEVRDPKAEAEERIKLAARFNRDNKKNVPVMEAAMMTAGAYVKYKKITK